MTSITPRLRRDRRGWRLAALAAFALVFLRGDPAAVAQIAISDRWVSTWTTAEVGRPQNPALPAPAMRPFIANTRCPVPPTSAVAPPPGQTFAPPPYLHFTNQTLRQIVHTSIGGLKARVVLSNAYGTAPVTLGGAPHRASRQAERHPGRVRPRADVQRKADDHHPRVRRDVQRPRRT